MQEQEFKNLNKNMYLIVNKFIFCLFSKFEINNVVKNNLKSASFKLTFWQRF